jgi:hypothetical protein
VKPVGGLGGRWQCDRLTNVSGDGMPIACGGLREYERDAPTRIANRRLRYTGGREKKLHTNFFTLWKNAESGLPITFLLGDCSGNAKAYC